MTGIYTVAMIPVTAGARRVTNQVNLEYEAEDAPHAIRQAKADCLWDRPEDNFAWRIIGRKVPGTACESSEKAGGPDAD